MNATNKHAYAQMTNVQQGHLFPVGSGGAALEPLMSLAYFSQENHASPIHLDTPSLLPPKVKSWNQKQNYTDINVCVTTHMGDTQ